MGRVRKKYPREFKLEAVRLMQKGESNTSELARRLNVSEADPRLAKAIRGEEGRIISRSRS